MPNSKHLWRLTYYECEVFDKDKLIRVLPTNLSVQVEKQPIYVMERHLPPNERTVLCTGKKAATGTLYGNLPSHFSDFILKINTGKWFITGHIVQHDAVNGTYTWVGEPKEQNENN